jgi:hypothetical protein
MARTATLENVVDRIVDDAVLKNTFGGVGVNLSLEGFVSECSRFTEQLYEYN